MSQEDYEGLRACLNENYQDATYEELDKLLDNIFEKLTPEQEGSISNILGRIGNVVAQTAQGALSGLSRGGISGAIAGGVTGLARGVSRTTQQQRSNEPEPMQPQPSPHAPRTPNYPQPAGFSTARGTQPASAQLLQMIQSPQLFQALISLLTGSAGRSSININPANQSQTSVPIGSILNLLTSLANRASLEANEMNAGLSVPKYLYDQSGEALGDIANPDERARILWEGLQEDEDFLLGTEFIDKVESEEDMMSDWLEGDYDFIEDELYEAIAEWDE